MLCRPVPFDELARSTWDRLLAAAPAATPFARWTFHRAWWDAYGSTAHEQYVLVVDEAGEARAIVPLMHRHQVEPQDEPTATVLRHRERQGTAVPAQAKTVFFAASYHADYATLLADPQDLRAVSTALVDYFAGPPDTGHGDIPWDAIDLRRLQRDDPARTALASAFGDRAAAEGWQIVDEQEDVCPVVSAPGADWDEYLATLGKKHRHEIRRKLRRAEAAGGLGVSYGLPDRQSVERFIELHQARFGSEGLFPPTEGGERSRRFIHRLAELEATEPDGGQLRLAEVTSGERLIFGGLAFDDGQTCYLYNSGMDPHASDLSPGVTGTAELIRDRLAAGRRRFDFLRGDEPYKYQWGAVDEPVDRLLVLRSAGPA